MGMAAKMAHENMPSTWIPFMTTQGGINTTHPNPSPPVYSSAINPSFGPLDLPIPTEYGLPPPLNIPPDSVSVRGRRQLSRHRPSPRPVVCTKDFHLAPEDAPFYTLILHARADKNSREPATLKTAFAQCNKGGCPNPKHSTCFTILIGPDRGTCRTESVALRTIQIALGLCWTCQTW